MEEHTWKSRLRARMKEIGLRQHELAERIDVAQSTVARWLAKGPHQNQPNLETFDKIADALAMDVVWLLHGKESARSPVEAKIVSDMHKMSKRELEAVLALVNSLATNRPGDEGDSNALAVSSLDDPRPKRGH